MQQLLFLLTLHEAPGIKQLRREGGICPRPLQQEAASRGEKTGALLSGACSGPLLRLCSQLPFFPAPTSLSPPSPHLFLTRRCWGGSQINPREALCVEMGRGDFWRPWDRFICRRWGVEGRGCSGWSYLTEERIGNSQTALGDRGHTEF